MTVQRLMSETDHKYTLQKIYKRTPADIIYQGWSLHLCVLYYTS